MKFDEKLLEFKCDQLKKDPEMKAVFSYIEKKYKEEIKLLKMDIRALERENKCLSLLKY